MLSKEFISSKKEMNSQKDNEEEMLFNYLLLEVYPSYDGINNKVHQERTGKGAVSLFGRSLRFDISKSFPLLTARKLFFRGIFEELMWFLRGQTNSKILEEKGVTIWKANSSEETLKKLKLPYTEGDCGPIYGHQWRYYGAEYKNCQTDYKGQGYDQIAEVVRLLKEDPFSRRIIINGWNPLDLNKVCLPCCHVLYQFNVREENSVKYLDCCFFQRSSDIFLAGGWNIASAALLTYLLASITGYTPGELIWQIGNIHIYSNHLDKVLSYLDREVYPFPTLKILNKKDNLEDYTFEDLLLENYQSGPAIKLEMNV